MSTGGAFEVDPVARLKASRAEYEKKPQESRDYLVRCVDVMTVELYAGHDDAGGRSAYLVMWSDIGKMWAERFACYDQLQALEALMTTAGAFGGLPRVRRDLAGWLFSALDGIGSRFRIHGEPVPIDGRMDPNEVYRNWFGGIPPGEEVPAKAVQAWVAGALMVWRNVKDQV